MDFKSLTDVKALTEKLKKFVKETERKRLILYGGIAAAVIVFAIFAATLLSQKEYKIIYSGLEAREAGEILENLRNRNIDARAVGTDRIEVPSDVANDVILQLANEGIPRTGFNYDIYTQSGGLGATDAERKVMLSFQLQENLRSTIKQMEGVEDAVVNISLAEETPFVVGNDASTATAAVMLTLASDEKLEKPKVQAIAELVARSVQNLQPENVAIVDSNMNKYSSVSDELSSSELLTSQLELRNRMRDQLQEQLSALLTPVFGRDKVSVEVNLKLNFDKETEASVAYFPPAGRDEGLAVSMETLIEEVRNATAADAVGVDANGGAPYYPTVGNNLIDYNKISEKVNLEIDETRRTIEKSFGRIEDISVSVILDSNAQPERYEGSVRNLISTAVGADLDKITVASLPFAPVSEESQFTRTAELMNDLNTSRLIQTLIIAFVILLVSVIIYLILRKKYAPAIAGDVSSIQSVYEVAAPEETEQYMGQEQYAEPESVTSLDGSGTGDEGPDAGEANDLLELFNNEPSNAKNFIIKMAEKDPEAIAILLKTWLDE